jgi:hypothetical protein
MVFLKSHPCYYLKTQRLKYTKQSVHQSLTVVSCTAMPHGLVGGYQHFGGMYHLPGDSMFSEMLVFTDESTRCQSPEHHQHIKGV